MSRNIGDRYFDDVGNEFEVVDVQKQTLHDGTIVTVENSIRVSS